MKCGWLRQRGDLGGQLSVTDGAVGRLVIHLARPRGQLGFLHVPGLRGRGDEHGAGCRAHLAHRQPVRRSSRAAAGDLAAVLRGIHVGLLDLYILPIDVEFVGDQHGQHGSDALADLGILGHDGDGAIRGDLNIVLNLGKPLPARRIRRRRRRVRRPGARRVRTLGRLSERG